MIAKREESGDINDGKENNQRSCTGQKGNSSNRNQEENKEDKKKQQQKSSKQESGMFREARNIVIQKDKKRQSA